MRRFFALWAILSPVYLLAAALSSWLVLNRLDLTPEAVAAWLWVPPVQALALALAEKRAARTRIPLTPLPLAVAGAGLLLAAALAARAVPVTAAVTRVPAALAGLALLAAVPRRGRTLVPLGLLLLLLGLDPLVPWLAALSRLVPLGRLYQWLVVDGVLALGLLAAALAAQRALEQRTALAARLLGAALACAFVAANATVLEFYSHPFLDRPWDALVPALLSLSASLAIAAALDSLRADAT